MKECSRQNNFRLFPLSDFPTRLRKSGLKLPNNCTISIILSFSTTELPILPRISFSGIIQRCAVQPRTTIANIELGNEHVSLKKKIAVHFLSSIWALKER